MKFLKRLYACLKHYQLPEVMVFGELCRMTGAWTVGRLHYGEPDLMFEVLQPFSRVPRFVTWSNIHEVHRCPQ